MNTFNEDQVLLNIQQLIDKSRCGVDGFFTDSKTAATDILNYLQNENIITKNKTSVDMTFNGTSKAA